MYAAMNQKGDLIYAINYENSSLSNTTFYCPKCHQVVFLKRSVKDKWYFAHLKKCGSKGEGSVKKNESAKHKLGKDLLAGTFTGAKKEFYFKETNQKVDVYIDQGGRMAFEYQLSPIHPKIIKSRHEDYQRLAIKDYWIGDAKIFKRNISPWAKRLLHFDKGKGFYIICLNEENQSLEIYSQLPIIFSYLKWSYYQFSVSLLKENWWTEFQSPKFQTKQSFALLSQRDSLKKWHWMIKQSTNHRFLINQLYSRGLRIEEVPLWIFKYRWQSLFLLTPTWEYLILIWLWLGEYHVFCESDLEIFILKLVDTGRIKVSQLPLVDLKIAPMLSQVTLCLFEKYRWIVNKGEGIWMAS